MKKRQQQKGFTLIEMMIVVVIVGMLAAIGIPSFIEHQKKSRRSDARTLLMQIVAKEERYFQDNRKFTSDFTKLGGLPASAITATEATSENGFYKVTFNATPAPTDFTYTLTATPAGSQASDYCKLTIDQDGTKGFSVYVPAGATDEAERTAKASLASCWGD